MHANPDLRPMPTNRLAVARKTHARRRSSRHRFLTRRTSARIIAATLLKQNSWRPIDCSIFRYSWTLIAQTKEYHAQTNPFNSRGCWFRGNDLRRSARDRICLRADTRRQHEKANSADHHQYHQPECHCTAANAITVPRRREIRQG